MTKDNNRLGKFDLTNIPPMPRGVPQIEVTFDLDANGILNVTAEEKKTGHKSNITITNDMGRLSKDQIEKMVAEAERFREQDQQAQERVKAKNGLENYIYSLRNTLNEEKFKNALPEQEKAVVMTAVEDAQKWLDTNEAAEKDEFEAKQKEVETVAMPLMQKMYQGAGGAPGGGMPDTDMGGMGSGSGSGSGSGPTVEEVD